MPTFEPKRGASCQSKGKKANIETKGRVKETKIEPQRGAVCQPQESISETKSKRKEANVETKREMRETQ